MRGPDMRSGHMASWVARADSEVRQTARLKVNPRGAARLQVWEVLRSDRMVGLGLGLARHRHVSSSCCDRSSRRALVTLAYSMVD